MRQLIPDEHELRLVSLTGGSPASDAEGYLLRVACRLTELVIDGRFPDKLARFWCEVLDYVVIDRDEDSVEIGPDKTARRDATGQPTIVFSVSVEPKAHKLRLHMDVNPTDRDQDDELDRLLHLGARPIDIGQTGQESWHVLQDPEGNEFCLLRSRVEA